MKKWRIRDIIDLEYFFHKDAVSQYAENQHYLSERDRNIFLRSVKPCLKGDETPSRQFIIRAWLKERREKEAAADAVLPGESFESLYSSFRIFFALAGFIAGGAAGLSFLTYTGDRPVNVFVYLSVFVFSQILLLLLFFFLSLGRLKPRSFFSSAPLYRAISRSMLRTVLWARSRISAKMGAEQRSRVEDTLGFIMNKGRGYGFLFFLPIVILTQLFAVGFNLGLLATTVFKIITADIAFGWQSTLQLSPETLFSLVQKIALPWSWLVTGGSAFPSLAQIEGSRIILKEGIYHLSTPDLVSWWPFLCYSVMFYGLLPRLFLFLGAAAVQRRHLGSLDFRQGIYEQLLLRMTTPLVDTRGCKVEDGGAAADFAGQDRPAAFTRPAARNLLVMIPDDIFESCPAEEIKSAVRNRSVAAVTQIIRFNKDYETDSKILAELKNSSRPSDTDILIVQEAWQPPIAEYINFIKNLRHAIGSSPCIRIGLIGKPQPNTIFTPVKEENRRIWTRKINAIGDPCIYTQELVNNAS